MQLLRIIHNHLRRTGMSESGFGRAALGDPAFVATLRRGREPRLATVRRVLAYIEASEETAARADRAMRA